MEGDLENLDGNGIIPRAAIKIFKDLGHRRYEYALTAPLPVPHQADPSAGRLLRPLGCCVVLRHIGRGRRSFKVTVSYLEIYNEQLCDLLAGACPLLSWCLENHPLRARFVISRGVRDSGMFCSGACLLGLALLPFLGRRLRWPVLL